MSLLNELKTIMETLSVPVETGVFSDPVPDRYVVLTPMIDRFDVFADNVPEQDIEEVRISLFDKGNYRQIKKSIESRLFESEITITGRSFIGREDDTGYNHYAIDVAKNYEYKTEEQ